MSEPLKLMIYDDTCRGQDGRTPLTYSWMAGHAFYKALSRLDHARGARSWEEALRWLCEIEPDRTIAEIQFWGHGKWGEVRINKDVLGAQALKPGDRHHDLLCAVRARLVGPEALWWFRTCETFGADPGQDFARRWTDFMQSRAAGHTFIIGPWQSGLHSLRPGEVPRWSAQEGLAKGSSPADPRKAQWSAPWQPNTITCLHGAIPADY